MKKVLRKLMSVVLCSCFFLSVPHVVNAKTENKNTKRSEVLFTIEVKDEKELKIVLKDLEDYNNNSKKMWENAVNQSKKEASKNIDKKIINPSARANFSMNKVESSIKLNGIRANLRATVTYDKITSPYPSFGEIYALTIGGQDSNTTVTNPTVQKRPIDSGRTLACNATSTVGVKTYGGDIVYYSIISYFEFYASGGGRWYSNEQ